MEIKCEKGQQVILTDNCDQSFRGLVKSVNHQLGRIVLSDVVQLPDQKVITGYRNFDKNEIREIKKYEVEEFKDVSVVEVSVKQKEQTETPQGKFPQIKINEILELQRRYRYIKDFGTNFNSAITSIKSCNKIGVYGKGTSEGRFGRASILAVSTPSNIFVFDLQTLGDDGLHKGLKEILESSNIIKVVHDCRLLSDCLKHKHLISLEGIRDVEAEDIMLVYQERKMIRKHNRPLKYLIKVYLGVEVDGVNPFADFLNHHSITCNPEQTKQVQVLVSLVSFLVPLQEAIQQKYIQRLIDASNVYNTYVRSLDFFEFLHDDATKTLRRQMIKLVIGQTHVRVNCRKNKLQAW